LVWSKKSSWMNFIIVLRLGFMYQQPFQAESEHFSDNGMDRLAPRPGEF